MVVAVVDVSLSFCLEAFFQVFKSSFWIYAVCDASAVQLVTNFSLAFYFEESIQQAKPLDQSVVPSERPKLNSVVRRLETEHF